MEPKGPARVDTRRKTRKIVPAILLIILPVSGYFFFIKKETDFPKAGKVVEQSIAILPFTNMSNDPDQEFFSDGLTEGIQNSLSHLRSLKVTSQTSSFKFRGDNVSVQEIGKRLGVRTVLEGSVQRHGDRITIKVQLINTEDALHLWSQEYNGELANVLDVQSKIAEAITEKLKITMVEEDRQVLGKKQTSNEKAYELYLKGRSFWNLRTPPDLKRGIDFFRQAIAMDTLYAVAYAGLADCYSALGYGSHVSPREAFPKALQAARKALELDSTLAEPHASLGYCHFYYDWDWDAAEEEFRKAISKNPNYEIGYDAYGYFLTAMQRYDEAAIVFNKAAALDPLSVAIHTDLGFSLYYSGAYDEAAKVLQSSLAMNPKYHLGRIWLGRIYQAKKMYPESIVEYKIALAITPYWPVALAQIGNVYGVSGNQAGAEQILATLDSLSSKKYVTPYGVALVYAGLGKNDLAFSWLNKAYEDRAHWLVWLKSDPRWILIREEKQYLDLVSKVGLPETSE